jgi:hypothetical protein
MFGFASIDGNIDFDFFFEKVKKVYYIDFGLFSKSKKC